MKKIITIILTAAMILTSVAAPVQAKAAEYVLKWTSDKPLDTWIDTSGPDGEFIQVYYYSNESKDGKYRYDVWIWTDNGGHIRQEYSWDGVLGGYEEYSVDDSGTKTTKGYNATGKLISEEVTDSAGNSNKKEYDESGKLVSEKVTDSAGNSNRKEYDESGKLVSEEVTDSAGNSNVKKYDENEKLISVTEYRNNGSEEIEIVYTYDENERIISETQYSYDRVVRYDYIYDSNGEFVEKVLSNSGSENEDEDADKVEIRMDAAEDSLLEKIKEENNESDRGVSIILGLDVEGPLVCYNVHDKALPVSSWKSANTKIVTVDKNGILHPKKAGKTTVEATLKENGKKYTVPVTVLKNEYVFTICEKPKKIKKKERYFQGDITGIISYDKSGNLILSTRVKNYVNKKVVLAASNIDLKMKDKKAGIRVEAKHKKERYVTVKGKKTKTIVWAKLKSSKLKNKKYNLVRESYIMLKTRDLSNTKLSYCIKMYYYHDLSCRSKYVFMYNTGEYWSSYCYI